MRSDHGQVLVLVLLLFIPVMLAGAAFAIDLGRMTMIRSDYEQALTAAAQAGAGDTNPCDLARGVVHLDYQTTPASCGANSPSTATAVARSYLAKNVAADHLPQATMLDVSVVQSATGGGGCSPLTRTCYRYPTVVMSATVPVRDLSWGHVLWGALLSREDHVVVAATASPAATQRTS